MKSDWGEQDDTSAEALRQSTLRESRLPTQRRHVRVHDYGTDSGSPSAAESEGEELPYHPRGIKPSGDFASAYWTVLKSINLLRTGKPDVCFAALTLLGDIDFLDNSIMAFVDTNGLELLLNLMEVNHERCRYAALRVMEKITLDPRISVMTVDLGIGYVLSKLLREAHLEIIERASAVTANVGSIRRVSRAIRKNGGIPILVSMLDLRMELLIMLPVSMKHEEKLMIKCAVNSANALWSLARFHKNKIILRKNQVMQLVTKILMSGHKDLSVALMGLMEECSTEPYFQTSIETEGLVSFLVKELKHAEPEMQFRCAVVMERAAKARPNTRDMIRESKGLEVLMHIVQDCNGKTGKTSLLAAALGVIWRTAYNTENAQRLYEMGLLPVVCELLNEFDDDVRTTSAGVIAELAKLDEVKRHLVQSGSVVTMTHLLVRPTHALVCNLVQALGECAKIPEGIKEIVDRDCIRFLWSLLRNRNPSVQTNVLATLRHCVKFAPNAGDIVRCLSGALQMIVDLVSVGNYDISTAACAVVSQVAKDMENLVVMTQHGIVAALAWLLKKVPPDHPGVCHVALAIGRCGRWGDNSSTFGKLGAVTKLCELLPGANKRLTRFLCRGLKWLCENQTNCYLLYFSGAVPYLLSAMGNDDPKTQVAAAECLASVRKERLRAEGRQMHRIIVGKSKKDSLPKISRQAVADVKAS